MRFADMMNRIKQNIAWPNERARDDAVLELIPKFDSTYRFPEVTDAAERARKIDGKFALEYVYADQPLPREFFPAWVSFGPYKLKNATDMRRGGAWPADVPQVLPDFYKVNGESIMISSFAREIFDVYCPGALEYLEVEVRAPEDMIVAPAYYFIEVLTQRQMIDWSRIDSSRLRLDSKNPVNSEADWHRNSIPFKSLSESSDLLWHEQSLDSDHRARFRSIYVRGKLWNILIDNFDQQFQHRTQLSLDFQRT